MKVNACTKFLAFAITVLFVPVLLNLVNPLSVRAQDIVTSDDTKEIVFNYQDGSSQGGSSKTVKSIGARPTKKTAAASKDKRKFDGRGKDSTSQKDLDKDKLTETAPSTVEPLDDKTKEPVLAGGILNGLTNYFEMLGFSEEDLKKYRGDEIKVQILVNAEGDVTKAQATSGPVVLREAAAKLARRASFYRSRFMNNPISLSGELIYVVGEGDEYKKYDKSLNKTPLVVNGGNLNGKEISSFVNGASVNSAGEVKVQVTVDEEGRVIAARAVSGNSALHKAAVESAQSWIFPRTSVLGSKVKVNGYIVINFKNSI